MDARIQNQVEVDEIVSQWTPQHVEQEAMQWPGIAVLAGTHSTPAEI